MTTPRKTATTKAAPKRTSAAKKTAKTTPRKKLVIAPPSEEIRPPVTEVSEEEKQAKIEAYYALKQANVSIPAELRIVEDWIADILSLIHISEPTRP